MSNREQFFAIPDLIFAKEDREMSAEQWRIVENKLDNFITEFPEIDSKIKSALTEKNYDLAIKQLENLSVILKDINAKGLSDGCVAGVKILQTETSEKVEAYITLLLSKIASLSIDVQIAIFVHKNHDLIGTEPTLPSSFDDADKELAMAETQVNENYNSEQIKTVVAVDDDPYCLHLLKAALSHLPLKVIAVNSGKAALKLLEKVQPDIFVLDIIMPEMDGIELARNLRKQGQKATIVFLTGNATQENTQKCLEVGATDLIMKPIYTENVARRIAKQLMINE